MNDETKFLINEHHNDDIHYLSINGYLDAHTAPVLEKSIADVIERGNNKILVDFANLDYISSAGLGVFMAFIEDIRNSGGDIKMCNMNEKVYSVFDLLGFPLLFDIEKEESRAVEKFKLNEIKRLEE